MIQTAGSDRGLPLIELPLVFGSQIPDNDIFPMRYYPAFLNLAGRECLVIGGGQVALRKAAALLSCGAKVRVVSPELGEGLRRLLRLKRVVWIRRRFRPSDLRGARLAVCATDDDQVSRLAAAEAARRGIWMNVVDQPALCSFIVPSVVHRGRLALAISTGGASPALAKWIRKDLQARYGPEFGRLVARMAGARGRVLRAVPSSARRKRLFERALSAYLRVLQGA